MSNLYAYFGFAMLTQLTTLGLIILGLSIVSLGH